MLGGVNRARATLDARRRELLDREGRAEFAAEFALLGQAVTGALAAADTPDACDEQLAGCCSRWRTWSPGSPSSTTSSPSWPSGATEVYEAFSARKQTLLDERARRADRLADSAARVLETVSPPRWPPSPTWTRSTPTSPPTRWSPRSAASRTSCADSATRYGPRNSTGG